MSYSSGVVRLCRILVFLALASPLSISAQTGDETLKLNALIGELIRVNPDVQSAYKRYQASLTRPSQEGALPDPRISLGWMSAGTILPGGGLGEDPNANIGLQISQEFPYPGKRGIRVDAAQKEAETQRQMWSATIRERITQIKTAYFELLFSYQALDILQENQQTLRNLSKVAEARYAVGTAQQQDLIRAETQVAILENQILGLQQKRESLAAEINSLINRPASNPLGRPEAVAVPQLEDYEGLLAAAKQNSPMLLSRQAMIQNREAGLKLAKKDSYPDFEIMGGYYNQGKMEDMWEVRGSVSIPIYLSKKQHRKAEEAALQLGEAHQDYRSVEQMLEFRLRDAYVKARTSLNLTELYSKQIVPQSKLALESSLASYETGGVDFLTVLTNFTTILEYRMNYFEQQAEYLKAHAVLEELAGPAEEAQL